MRNDCTGRRSTWQQSTTLPSDGEESKGSSESGSTVESRGRNPTGSRPDRGAEPPRFANRIELECARILDWYGIPWEYEPTSFVLERDTHGRVTRAFTPDFFLPEENLYIEVTVMKQSLVTRKNRKSAGAARAVPGGQRQALLPARSRAPRPAIPTEARVIGHDPAGAVHLSAAEIAARVRELGAEIAADYAGREPLLVAPLKSSTVFLADLSRALPILHAIDVVELAGYSDGGRGGVRLLKDLDTPIDGRDVLLVEDVVDTGLTLAYLTRTLAERGPASIAAVTLLDRPYRRLVENIGLRYVGFTVPDELFAGYGLGLEERWRALPDLRYIPAEALPAAATDAA